MDVDTRGVSAAFLRRFLRGLEAQHAGRYLELTTRDARDLVVRPRTQERKCAYVDVVEQETPGDVAQANVFVSHAWRYKITDVLGALLEYADARDREHEQQHGEGQRPPPLYFWFDLFLNNQHILADLPQEWCVSVKIEKQVGLKKKKNEKSKKQERLGERQQENNTQKNKQKRCGGWFLIRSQQHTNIRSLVEPRPFPAPLLDSRACQTFLRPVHSLLSPFLVFFFLGGFFFWVVLFSLLSLQVEHHISRRHCAHWPCRVGAGTMERPDPAYPRLVPVGDLLGPEPGERGSHHPDAGIGAPVPHR